MSNKTKKIIADTTAISYLKQVFFSTLIVAVLVFGINWVVDPLWFGAGNQISGMNYAFNERISKMNRWFQNPQSYDCLIFGSSRVTLLNEKQIQGWNCYNFSISNGLIIDLLHCIEYVANRVISPRMVIIGVDGINFALENPYEGVPEFILADTEPPGIFSTYLSLDSLKLSYKTLIKKSPLPRYYQSNFTIGLLDNRPDYKPGHGPADTATYTGFSTRNVSYYKRIRDTFPSAKMIAYTPPLSTWAINNLAKQGHLDGYLKSIHAVSQIIQPFYDFGIPSDITSRSDNTYDGSHYDLDVNALISRVLTGESNDFGIRVDLIELSTYIEMYKKALNDFYYHPGE